MIVSRDFLCYQTTFEQQKCFPPLRHAAVFKTRVFMSSLLFLLFLALFKISFVYPPPPSPLGDVKADF